MKAAQIFSVLQELAPLSLGMPQDNIGFLIGDPQTEVTKTIIGLDCTTAVVNRAIEEQAQLIITHHPVIFDPLRSVTATENGRVFACLSNHIAVISMHTNLDSAAGGVNDCLAAALGLINVRRIEAEDGLSFRRGELAEAMSAEGFAQYIKSRLNGVVRYTDGGKIIETVAVCGGSGGDYMDLAMRHADAFVTADLKHHQLIMAVEKGYSVFDAGHFHTENTVVEPLATRLGQRIPEVAFLAYDPREIKTA